MMHAHELPMTYMSGDAELFSLKKMMCSLLSNS